MCIGKVYGVKVQGSRFKLGFEVPRFGAAWHSRLCMPRRNVSGMSNTYRDLKVWQRSIDLTEKIYRLTGTFPATEAYGLTSQMRRAAVSIASNIAEGWGRRSWRDYGKSVLIARGSNDELQTQLVIAERLGFGDAVGLADANALAIEIGRMLAGLYTFLQRPRSDDSSKDRK
jgi:four helix bundle protein